MTRRPVVAVTVVLAGFAVLAGASTVAGATGAMGAGGESSTGAAGTSAVEVVVDGVRRDAVVHVPPSVAAHPDRPAPLVLHLHGGLGSPENSIATTRLVEAADANRFVVVFPRGTPTRLRLPDGRTAGVWNAGRCCGLAVRNDVDDVAFLRALIDQLRAGLPVDPQRVVMSGHSNGAMMAWRFACEQPGVLAAVMPVAGSLETDDPDACSARGTALLAVHGDADRNHPIDGGRGTRSVSGVDYRPFADSVAAYARASRCARNPTQHSTDIETVTRWRRCARGIEVRSVVVHGADHPWPGGIASVPALQGEPFAAWSATDALVELVASTES